MSWAATLLGILCSCLQVAELDVIAIASIPMVSGYQSGARQQACIELGTHKYLVIAHERILFAVVLPKHVTQGYANPPPLPF